MRHAPSFTVARLDLAPHESVRVEPGVMVASSYGVAVQTQLPGGLLASLARAALGGASTLVSTFTAPAAGGWVDVAPRLPGDLRAVTVNGADGGGWCLTRTSWLASDGGVELAAQWRGFRSLFGGEGGFLLHAEGSGELVLAGFGAVEELIVPEGEYVTVDSGHVIGYPDAVQSRIRPASRGGTHSMRSGEGLVFDFAGPARILTQTRNPRGLVSWLQVNGLGVGS